MTKWNLVPVDCWRELEPYLGKDVPNREVVLLSDVKGVLAAPQPPAPSVPDVAQTIPSHDQLTQILNGLDRCVSAESRREFLRVWIRDWTVHKLAAAPTPAEPPADLVRDAERLRQFEKWADAGYAPCLAYDDDGHWQISFDGFNAVGEPLGRVTIFTEKDDWHDSVGEAIDAAIGRQGGE